MSAQSTDSTAPLDDVMLAMDVVDTLRHRQDLVSRELDAAGKQDQLIEKLRAIYHEQGIEVPDHILQQGVDALTQARFTYSPPEPSWARRWARLYVSRGKWGPLTLGLFMALVLGFGGYFLAYRPYQAAQAENARLELAEGLPARMDQIYNAIFEETKVQEASTRAAELVARGKRAAAEGNRAGAERAVADLTAMRDTLRLEYSLRIVNQPDQDTGFWRSPRINTAATNYYIVVEALDPDGKPVPLPVLNEETGATQMVTQWGLRVPETVYTAVANDKRDDGIIQNNIVGIKQYGYLNVTYRIAVLGGAVTL